MSFATTCLITFHFVFKFQNGLSTPLLNQFVLQCSLVRSQNACDFCPLPRIGSCKITKKLQHIYLSSFKKKLFAILCLSCSCHCHHNWVKYEATISYPCFTSLKENTLAHVFDITILGVHWTFLLTPQNHDLLACCHYRVIYSLLLELQLGKSLNTKPSSLNFEINGYPLLNFW